MMRRGTRGLLVHLAPMVIVLLGVALGASSVQPGGVTAGPASVGVNARSAEAGALVLADDAGPLDGAMARDAAVSRTPHPAPTEPAALSRSVTILADYASAILAVATLATPATSATPVSPTTPVSGTTAQPLPALPPAGTRISVPDVLWAAYRNAASKVRASCRLPVTLLAAIGHVESGSLSGRSLTVTHDVVPPVLGPVLSGGGVAAIRDTDGGRLDGDAVWDRAVGPMQFIPGTWRTWGRDGNGDGVADPQNIEDATLSAAAYLCAGDRDLSDPAQLRAAILSYNSSSSYVATVLGLMASMQAGGAAIPGGLPATKARVTVSPRATARPTATRTPATRVTRKRVTAAIASPSISPRPAARARSARASSTTKSRTPKSPTPTTSEPPTTAPAPTASRPSSPTTSGPPTTTSSSTVTSTPTQTTTTTTLGSAATTTSAGKAAARSPSSRRAAAPGSSPSSCDGDAGSTSATTGTPAPALAATGTSASGSTTTGTPAPTDC